MFKPACTLFVNIVKAHMFGGNVVILFQVFYLFCQEFNLHANYKQNNYILLTIWS